MAAATLENKLYEAAAEGSVTVLLELIRQDRLLLDRMLINYAVETPLHVAAMLGHTDFVKEIIQRKPEFTKELDSKGSSPLHVASAKGYVEIVKALLVVNPDMCLAADKQGRNPLHLAAMKGQVQALKELVRIRPRAARMAVASGGTILHLCVKYGQFEALRLLVEVMNDHEIVNAKDDYGMSILHLAVAYKQIEIIKFLLSGTSVEVNGLNANGLTALDVLAQSRRGLKDFEMAESLRGAGALKAAEISYPGPRIVRLTTETTPLLAQDGHEWVEKSFNKEDWLTRKRDSLMVVASLMATMSFQTGLTPPGGLWQDGLIQAPQGNNQTEGSYEAGTSITAYRNQSYYGQYLAANTISFIASMSIILLLITGLPFKRRFFMWILTVTMWVAISAMAYTYRISLLVFTPKSQELKVTEILNYALVAWLLVMAALLIAHTIRLTVNIFKKVEHVVRAKRPSPSTF
ncbi:hypothetical protein V6N13_045699 [Hibiscus sabdariffa]|uniref:Uncharacterized protein n=2 Tax=Hibiscus sabdariffa TaxID=183260 RepID=A0ABR2NHS7_9ROSI